MPFMNSKLLQATDADKQSGAVAPSTQPERRRRLPWGSILLGLFLTLLLLRLIWATELGRELLAKSFMTLAGYLGTPFVLEASFFMLGWVLVLTWNERRRKQDGPDWVEMEVQPKTPEKDPRAD